MKTNLIKTSYFFDENKNIVKKVESQETKDLNASVLLTRYCNAHCWFCMENFKNQCDLKNDENKDFKLLDKITNHLTKLRKEDVSLSITGGEPTSSPLFLPLMEKVKELGFKKSNINTNGSLLLKNDMENLKAITNANLDFLNISVPYYNDKENAYNMGVRKPCVTLDDLIKINNFLKDKKTNITLSCLANKKGVSSAKDVINYINTYNKAGIHSFAFREMAKVNEKDFSNPLKYKFYESNWCDEMEIIKEFSKMDNVILKSYHKGFYYDVFVFKYKDNTVTFKRVDLDKMETQNKEQILEYIITEKGKLQTTWDK